MTNKQFTKFAEGILKGFNTMQDLRSYKTSLFDTEPALKEGNNWNDLIIFARGAGLQPECNHIRVARSKAQVLEVFVKRGYTSVGEVKYLRKLINLYVKSNTVDWDFKDILADWKEIVKQGVEDTFDAALSEYTYNNVLKEVSKLVFNNPTFKEVVVSAIGAGLLNLDNPVQFVRNWYSYTDFEGNLLVPVNYINKDHTIIATRWEFKKLSTSNSITIWENALRNVKRCFKAGKLGNKYTPLKRAAQGSLTGNYWNVVVDEKGRYVKGDRIEYAGIAKDFDTTLADRNKEVKE